MHQRQRSTVLVVEDEPLIRLELAFDLEDAGYAVLEASNVLQAIAILGKNDIDALITDIEMPGGLCGLDLVEMVAGLSRDIAMIVTSGGRVPGEGDLPAATTFMAKPCRAADLIAELERQFQNVGNQITVSNHHIARR